MAFPKLSTQYLTIYLHFCALLKIVIVQFVHLSLDNTVISVKNIVCIRLPLWLYS